MPEVVQEATHKKKWIRLTQDEKKRILQLRENNKLPITDIGAIVGRHPATIDRFLDRVSPENKDLQAFKGKEADVYSYKKLLTSRIRVGLLESLAGDQEVFSRMTPDQKVKANQSLAISEGIDTEKERLIRGLSTNNLSYTDSVKDEDRVNNQLRSLGINPDKLLENDDNLSSDDVSGDVTTDPGVDNSDKS